MLHINQEQEHITNDDLYQLVNENPLIHEVHRRQLNKLGHVLRKPAECLTNTYALYTPSHGSRGPGRPKTSFPNYIAKVISPNVPPTEREIRLAAADRKQWRGLVNQAAEP